MSNVITVLEDETATVEVTCEYFDEPVLVFSEKDIPIPVYGDRPIVLSNNFYEGSYTVTPKAESQTLKTLEKTMKKDLLVNGIPYYETDNKFGGSTITIG